MFPTPLGYFGSEQPLAEARAEYAARAATTRPTLFIFSSLQPGPFALRSSSPFRSLDHEVSSFDPRIRSEKKCLGTGSKVDSGLVSLVRGGVLQDEKLGLLGQLIGAFPRFRQRGGRVRSQIREVLFSFAREIS